MGEFVIRVDGEAIEKNKRLGTNEPTIVVKCPDGTEYRTHRFSAFGEINIAQRGNPCIIRAFVKGEVIEI